MRRRDNQPMQWTKPAGTLVEVRSRRGAGSATDRPYVLWMSGKQTFV
jgi:hypothetical protein